MAIEDALKRCLSELEEHGKSWGTKAMVVNALRKFTRVNKVKDIDWDEIRQNLGEDESDHDYQPYSRELVQKIIQAANLRKQVVVGILASAGIRRGALGQLKPKHIKKMKLDSAEVFSLEIYANSEITICHVCNTGSGRYH